MAGNAKSLAVPVTSFRRQTFAVSVHEKRLVTWTSSRLAGGVTGGARRLTHARGGK